EAVESHPLDRHLQPVTKQVDQLSDVLELDLPASRRPDFQNHVELNDRERLDVFAPIDVHELRHVTHADARAVIGDGEVDMNEARLIRIYDPLRIDLEPRFLEVAILT